MTEWKISDDRLLHYKKNILCVDGVSALVVGLLVLAINGKLAVLYRMPDDLLLFIAGVNLAYGGYALSLHVQKMRGASRLFILITANLVWALQCILLAVANFETISAFGWAHLIAEALYVGTLASLELRWRDTLLSHTPRADWPCRSHKE